MKEERQYGSWMVQILLWICVGLLPMVGLLLWEIVPAVVTSILQRRVHWFSLLLSVQLLCGGVLLVLTGLRLLRARTPRWLWIAAVVLLGVATAAMMPELVPEVRTEYPQAGVSIGVALLTPAISAAMLALHGLWSWLEKETEETSDEYEA